MYWYGPDPWTVTVNVFVALFNTGIWSYWPSVYPLPPAIVPENPTAPWIAISATAPAPLLLTFVRLTLE